MEFTPSTVPGKPPFYICRYLQSYPTMKLKALYPQAPIKNKLTNITKHNKT